tara:strand:- start:172 stop:408 length:237 start_codon:yes stop_codon:yes gene_type:complete
MNNIPGAVKQMLSNSEITMSQKMVGFMMFMPTLPENPTVQKIVDSNLELGVEVKQLVDENKITLGKFDKNFVLDVKMN